MARHARTALSALVALAFTLAVAPARAQSLPQVHVDAVSLRPDRTTVAPHVPFHVRLHVHLREPGIDVAALVILPEITGAQMIADERRTQSDPSGSDFVEDLTLEADAPGIVTLANAHVDAIDPKNGKPFRYSAPPARVRVIGPTAQDLAQAESRRSLYTLGAWGAAIAVVLLVLLLLARRWSRRPRRVAPAPPPPPVTARPAEPPPPLRPYDRVRLAAGALGNARSRANAVAVRTELFALAGVSAGSTLRDALSHVQDIGVRSALIASERAAFAADGDLGPAIAMLLDAVHALPD